MSENAPPREPAPAYADLIERLHRAYTSLKLCQGLSVGYVTFTEAAEALTRAAQVEVQKDARIAELEQYRDWAHPQIITHGEDVLTIERLRAALEQIASHYNERYGGYPKAEADRLARNDLAEIASDALTAETKSTPAAAGFHVASPSREEEGPAAVGADCDIPAERHSCFLHGDHEGDKCPKCRP